MILKPRPLRGGDTVGLVAPAGPPREPEDIERGVSLIEELGFRVKVGRHARKRLGFLAGEDRERAEDLQDMFLDPEVQAVFCVRGGHGATRLLPLLDYRIFRRHPKIFLGFSDNTALHCAILRRAGLLTFHGPHLASQFARQKPPEHVRAQLVRALCDLRPPGGLAACCPRRAETVVTLRPGRVCGRLVGGNLSLLCCLVGTPFEPSWKNAILFFEDVNEPPYRVDRCLTMLMNAGRLQQVAGIAIGLCSGCVDKPAQHRDEYRQSLDDVLRERLSGLHVPVIMGLPFGHVPDNLTIPVGANATLDADHGDLLLDVPFLKA